MMASSEESITTASPPPRRNNQRPWRDTAPPLWEWKNKKDVRIVVRHRRTFPYLGALLPESAVVVVDQGLQRFYLNFLFFDFLLAGANQ